MATAYFKPELFVFLKQLKKQPTPLVLKTASASRRSLANPPFVSSETWAFACARSARGSR
jgi:hypothetical protein